MMIIFMDTAAFGIPKFYQIWIWSSDLVPNMPYFVNLPTSIIFVVGEKPRRHDCAKDVIA
jgi:hypothetical protein